MNEGELLMAVTPNYGLFVYGAEDTSVRFLDFRVNIAGTQSTSNFYVIDTKMKEMSDKIQTLENSPSAYSINATYSSENYYIASSLDFPGYEVNQLISLSLDRNNIGTVTININSSSTVSVMKYNNSGELVNMDDNDFTTNNPVLCIYDGTRFVAIGVKNANNINISGDEGDVVVVSPENKLSSSGKKIGEANGIASLDSSGNVQQPANSTVNSLTISLNGNAQTPFNGGNPVSFNITPESISAATSEQGQKADNLVSGDIPAGKSTVLETPRKIGNAEFDGSKDISIEEIGIINVNLLDNSNFSNPVNQRGKTSFPNAYNHYVIDRWYFSGNVIVSDGKITVSPYSGIQANGGTLITQANEASKVPYDGVYSISLKLNGQIYKFENVQVYARPGNVLWTDVQPVGNIGDNIRILFYRFVEQSNSNVYFAINSLTGEEFYVEWVKLEKGDVATPWQPKSYNEEYDECLRYFTRLIQWSMPGIGFVSYNGAYASILLNNTVRMRKAPTVTVKSGSQREGVFGSGTSELITVNPTSGIYLNGMVYLYYKQQFKTTTLYNHAVILSLNDTEIELSADL